MDTTSMSEQLDEMSDAARDAIKKAKEQLEPVDSWLREMTREHPLAVLGCALGLGYLVGRLLRRS